MTTKTPPFEDVFNFLLKMVISQCHISFQGRYFYQVIQDEMDILPETNSKKALKIGFPKRKDRLPAAIFRGPTLVLGTDHTNLPLICPLLRWFGKINFRTFHRYR